MALKAEVYEQAKAMGLEVTTRMSKTRMEEMIREAGGSEELGMAGPIDDFEDAMAALGEATEQGRELMIDRDITEAVAIELIDTINPDTDEFRDITVEATKRSGGRDSGRFLRVVRRPKQ